VISRSAVVISIMNYYIRIYFAFYLLFSEVFCQQVEATNDTVHSNASDDTDTSVDGEVSMLLCFIFSSAYFIVIVLGLLV